MLSPRQVRILVVDSDHAIRDMLAERFSIFGFQTLTADDGDQAWRQICSDSAIKIVVSNLDLPALSGIDLLAQCRKVNTEWPRFFFISNPQDQKSLEKALALGADGCLQKPFDARNLLNLVRSSLLSLAEKLRYPPYTVPSKTIKLVSSSLAEAQSTGRLALGRGGFNIVVDKDPPTVGEMVAFELELGEIALFGFGQVLWAKASQASSEVGVEIVFLKNQFIAPYQQWILGAQPSAYIPSFQIVASIPSTAKLQSTG